MKSYTDFALDIVESVFFDTAQRFPELQVSLDKDLSYLHRAIEQRGLGFLTLTLPDLGKWFERSLSNLALSDDAIPQGIKSKKNRPIFLQGLFSRVFDDCGLLRQDACVDSVFFIRQICYLFKKFRIECPPQRVKETLDEFFAIEDKLPPSHPSTWDSDVPVWSAREGHPLWGNPEYADHCDDAFDGFIALDDTGQRPWHTLRRLCRRVVSEFAEPVWWDFLPKHGPGVVAENIRKGSKYNFPNWPRKLESVFPYDWFGTGILDDLESVPSDVEVPSRLIAVPKTQKGPRLICAEPTAHQWMQQSIWRYLDGEVSRGLLGRSISFHSQQESRERALNASIDGDYATIDLSAASDRISTRLVEYVFQGHPILDGLHACRTRCMRQTISPDHDNMIVLRKFSTMGSAVTFPIQSILFAIIAIWTIRLVEGQADHFDGLEETADLVRVFGDDIIVPSRYAEEVMYSLTECGLKVNTAKSHWTGWFRESCGMDAFKGHDVSPAYILQQYDGSPSAMAATVEASNNFHKKGMWATAKAVLGHLPEKERKLLRVCGPTDGAFGLWSFVGTDTSHLKSGWCTDWQVPYSISLTVTSKATKERGLGFADLTQYFAETPRPDENWSAGTVRRVKLRKSKTRVYS